MSFIQNLLGQTPAQNTNYVPAAPYGAPVAAVPGSVPLAGDSYQNNYVASNYQVPTHTPAAITGGIVGWEASDKMGTSIQTMAVRKTRPAPEFQGETAAQRRAYQGEFPASSSAYDRQPMVEQAGYPVNEAPASYESSVQRAAPRLRDAKGHFLPRGAESARAPEASYRSGARSLEQPAYRAPRGAYAQNQALEGEVTTSRRAGAAVRSRATVSEVRMKTIATPKITSAGMTSVIKSSLLWSGGISLALNAYSVLKGQESFADGGTNVAGDLTSGAVSGVAGALVSTFGTAAIASVAGAGLAGFPLTLITLGLGIGGFWLTDKLLRKTNTFKSLTSDIHAMLGGGALIPPAAPVATSVLTPAAYSGTVPKGYYATPYLAQPGLQAP